MSIDRLTTDAILQAKVEKMELSLCHGK